MRADQWSAVSRYFVRPVRTIDSDNGRDHDSSRCAQQYIGYNTRSSRVCFRIELKHLSSGDLHGQADEMKTSGMLRYVQSWFRHATPDQARAVTSDSVFRVSQVVLQSKQKHERCPLSAMMRD